MRIGPSDSPGPEPGDEPPEPGTPRPVPHDGDVRVAGAPPGRRPQANPPPPAPPDDPRGGEPPPADWVPVQGGGEGAAPESRDEADERREQRERELAELYERRRRELREQRDARERRERVESGRPERPERPAAETEWTAAAQPPAPPAHEAEWPASEAEWPASGASPPEASPPEAPQEPTPVPHAPDPPPVPQPRPPASPPLSETLRDVPAWRTPEPRTAAGPMDDPDRRRTLVDTFVAEFVASATWRATLTVLESAFPGLGMAATLSRRTDELWRTIGTLDEVGAAQLGVPVWLDPGGMVFDLSARHRDRAVGPPGGQPVRPRASWPYAGAFVIDTLDPLRYHRAVGGPAAPGAPAAPPPGEEDDSGVVIVADLGAAGVRVLDAAALWRHAGRVVVATLHDPLRPETRGVARRALRALQRVVFVDPGLGLGLCLRIDVSRTPRCLLAFGVEPGDERTPYFVRP